MKKKILAAGEIISALLAVGNLGVIENNPYPPLSVYLLVILGVILMVFFALLLGEELEKDE